ncbi:TPA: restriction endonuclease subunit S [Klebsiella quasipneumoniae subsp. quasipneumoniae]|uniref:restriction endonuclease subunit S n=2 Tax=Klebsiella quasipneumoniae TaxID=1463165 RepID=UPI0006A4BB99|nr:restriction endonuclease subunit S [Klebsiella quasipneumoniae]KNG96135.1 type I restriction-modification system specificity determinant [Klebsiella quasipneumoniae subsp. quasipneumoniae]MCD7090176.1 restriction endonuclease subunit S [Klebsiella quasipneumoniae subsp. quasipneumoniae]HBR1515251.1 restriction endonuclease subunit S [Klebsiella quasipneumoniae subsp. quasipneumoniae]HBR1957955.1 restriction endonuclease subunit S [Klebsiella quasipneumoniae subsp. quasipneumoniae]HBW8902631
MAKYKAYPEYKDSGVKWLDKLPLNWSIEKTKRMFSLKRNLVGHLSSSFQLLSLTLNGVVPRDISSGEGKIPASFDTYQSVQAGDLIFCLFDIDETPRTIGLAEQDGMITGAYNVYSCMDKCLPSYAYYYFLHIDSFKGLKPFYTGLRKVVRAETFGCIEMPNPSLSEQEKICLFLDHETAEIDKLIEKQQQLIELLKEKRQAVISHAVTKGLNPDVPMKDSGVEWLGSIPKHWLCTKIKYIAILTPKKSSVNFKINNECTFIPMEKLKRNYLVTDESKLIRDVISGYTYFEDDDLLLAKVTPCFENKNIAVARGLVNSIGFGSTEIYVLRPTEKIRVNYLLYRLQEDNFIRAATGAMTGAGGLKRVPSDFLLNYPIAIPPKSEMDAIVAYLNAQEVHYDLMERNATQAVQLLQERRTALISAAVTGKIDVRDWVAPDTQDVEESQEATA